MLKALQRKRKVVSVFLTLFFTIMTLKVQSGMFCKFYTSNFNDEGGKLKFYKSPEKRLQFKVCGEGGVIEVRTSDSDQFSNGYRLAPDASGLPGRYQLSAVIDGHEFTQDNLRSILADEGEDGDWGNHAAVLNRMPIIQYEPHLYLLPIFNLNSARVRAHQNLLASGDESLNTSPSQTASGIFSGAAGLSSQSASSRTGISMMAYNTERREREWVEVDLVRFGRGLDHIAIPLQGLSNSCIEFYVAHEGGHVGIAALPLAEWALRAIYRQPSGVRGELVPLNGFMEPPRAPEFDLLLSPFSIK